MSTFDADEHLWAFLAEMFRVADLHAGDVLAIVLFQRLLAYTLLACTSTNRAS